MSLQQIPACGPPPRRPAGRAALPLIITGTIAVLLCVIAAAAAWVGLLFIAAVLALLACLTMAVGGFVAARPAARPPL